MNKEREVDGESERWIGYINGWRERWMDGERKMAQLDEFIDGG